MNGLFDFLEEVYGLLGFTFKLKLSTRPEKYLGEIETWNRAEAMLKESLDDHSAKTKVAWELEEGDGAFYGPKIDVKVLDSLRREWQVATFQLDFMNPESFNLEYVVGEAPVGKKDEEKEKEKEKAKAAEKPKGEKGEYRREDHMRALTPGTARPVMIHRAMAGSFERFTGILIEHFGGKWPFWLSPRQIVGTLDLWQEMLELTCVDGHPRWQGFRRVRRGGPLRLPREEHVRRRRHQRQHAPEEGPLGAARAVQLCL